MTENRKNVLVTGACINTGVDIVEKFAGEGYNVIFTGRKAETVAAKEAEYKAKFPLVDICGYSLGSLTPDGEVDEESVIKLFESLDSSDTAHIISFPPQEKRFPWRHIFLPMR